MDHASTNSLEIAEKASAATQIIASLEYLSLKSERERGGLNNWEHVQHQSPPAQTTLGKLVRRCLANENVYLTLHIARIGAAVVLISSVHGNKKRAGANAFLSATTALLYPMQLYGTDGSDQLSFVIHSAAGIGRVGGTNASRRAASDFIGAQTTLSYVAGGLTKLPGKDWRSGDALSKIMRTETYGDAGLSRFLQDNPWAGRVGSKVALIWEIGFPILMTRRSTGLVALAAGTAFHLFNARAMGLWRFAPPFIASYPAVWRLFHR